MVSARGQCIIIYAAFGLNYMTVPPAGSPSTDSPSDRPTPPKGPSPNQLENGDESIDVEAILLTLRRKQGNWVEWGQSCQTLQKAGHSPQQIFEATGFEPIHQNQIIVAAQVFKSILSQGVSGEVRSHFETRGSDTLYEFRILSQTARAKAATLVLQKGIDSTGAHDVAKAIREYTQRANPPEGFASFAEHPGDAMAYYYWRLARQQGDLQARSRLIAMGLKFASSGSARQSIEQLLTDFTVERKRPAPMLPTYRLDSEEGNPRIAPVAGKLPLSIDDVKAVPFLDEESPFGMVKFSGAGAWVPLPGWQVILLAEDPIVVVASADQLPGLRTDEEKRTEEVLVVVDREKREWSAEHYFLTTPSSESDQVGVVWSEAAIATPILGQVILVLRPKRILDEDLAKDPWQVE